MTRAALYCRISTSDQDLRNQLVVLTEWAKERGFEVVAIYEEEESAWKAGHQRALAQLVNDAKRGKFSILLV